MDGVIDTTLAQAAVSLIDWHAVAQKSRGGVAFAAGGQFFTRIAASPPSPV
jgi:hypothetical protein